MFNAVGAAQRTCHRRTEEKTSTTREGEERLQRLHGNDGLRI